MNDKKLVDLRKNFYVDTVAISGDYIRIVTDNANTVINLKDKAFADIKEININGAKFYKISEDSVVLSREEYERLLKIEKDFNTVHYCFVEKSRVVETRKETAMEILKEIMQEILLYLGVVSMKELDKLGLISSLLSYDVVTDKLHELAQRYNVEIGEEV